MEAKEKSFSLQSALNCPHCNMRLQNPEHLRNWSLYFKMILGFILSMVIFFYLIIQYENIGLFIGAPFMFGVSFLVIRSMKLKNGYIQMVELNE